MSDPTPVNDLTIQTMTRTEDETRFLAKRFAAYLKPGDVIALEGDLGAGKTCFVRGLAEGLGIEPSLVSSPTFVIAHEYPGTAVTLAHIDAYRIKSADDLETIGWSEMLSDAQLIIAIEWPSRISGSLPANRIDVRMDVVGPTERLIRFTGPPELADRLAPLGATRRSAPNARQVPCRTCGRTIDAGLRTYPFCSDRCRMADLGGWFTGGYKMTRPMADDELE